MLIAIVFVIYGIAIACIAVWLWRIYKDPAQNGKLTIGRIAKGIRLIARFQWVIFTGIILLVFRSEICDMIPYITSFKVAGIEATLNRDLTNLSNSKNFKLDDHCIKLYDRSSNHCDTIYHFISPKQKELIIARCERLYKKLKTTKILWVDPNISTLADIRKVLRNWGVSIDSAASDAEGYHYLKNAKANYECYDLIITNNHHHPLKDSIGRLKFYRDGIIFADSIKRDFGDLDIPVILFSASYGNNDTLEKRGIPENIFAATNRCDYLFHFIFDALERGNTPYPANLQKYIGTNEIINYK
jgi:CheY-like chemotaxis protein